MSQIHNNKIFKERRIELRKRSTSAEKKLWGFLRANKLGFKFKRQHSIGGYILDFYYAEMKLIVELDGEIHNTAEAQEYDEIRDKYFKELEYTTLRFFNREVEFEIGKVLDSIKNHLL